MQKVSVIIITNNEEKNIARCLESVRWADETVIVDSFSTDRTTEICRRFTDKVFQKEWLGYGLQKNYCASNARNKWVLNIDADEVISPECAEAIQKLLLGNPKFPIYRFPRKNYFSDRWVQYAGWYPDLISRLYDKNLIAFSESIVHERLMPNNNAGIISHAILHYSFKGMDDYIKRQNIYSTLYAEQKIKINWKANWTHLYLRPIWVFLKTYFLRQGFREGFLGVFLSVSMAFYTYLKYAKTRSIK